MLKIFFLVLMSALICLYLYAIKTKANWFYYPERTIHIHGVSFFTANKLIRKAFGEVGVSMFGWIQILFFILGWFGVFRAN